MFFLNLLLAMAVTTNIKDIPVQTHRLYVDPIFYNENNETYVILIGCVSDSGKRFVVREKGGKIFITTKSSSGMSLCVLTPCRQEIRLRSLLKRPVLVYYNNKFIGQYKIHKSRKEGIKDYMSRVFPIK